MGNLGRQIVTKLSLVCLLAASTLSFAKVELIVSPNPEGHPVWVQYIEKAKKSIHITIFNMTEAKVLQALKDAAQRNVDVKVIYDGKSGVRPKQVGIIDGLKASGVEVRLSSPEFSITHQKSMAVDGKIAFVTNMNLTSHAATTRDFGIITTTKSTVAELEKVFAADWENSEKGTGETPELTSDELLWSPINSGEKLLNLIDSAKKTLILEVENISYEPILDALIAAQKRGVKVRVITPLCNFNDNPFFNFPALRKLAAKGIETKVMGIPNSPELPYIHAKVITVDGQSSYVGSINFSFNSITRAREVGIIVDDSDIADQISTEFEKDWTAAQALPDRTDNIICPEIAK